MFDEGRWLSRRHNDTEMKANTIGTMVGDGAVEVHRDLGYLMTFGEALMRDGFTRIIHGTLDADPRCLREKRNGVPCLGGRIASSRRGS